MGKSQGYRSFLLTAWQEQPKDSKNHSVWHFGLEDVRGRSQKHVFMTLKEVMAYVEEKLDAHDGQQAQS